MGSQQGHFEVNCLENDEVALPHLYHVHLYTVYLQYIDVYACASALM